MTTAYRSLPRVTPPGVVTVAYTTFTRQRLEGRTDANDEALSALIAQLSAKDRQTFAAWREEQAYARR